MTERIRTINELANHRQYFRIEDKASVEIAVLSEQHSAAEYFKLNPEFGLISEFQLLDVEAKHLLHAVTEKDKNLGQLLRLFNKKLDALSRVVALTTQAEDHNQILEVNLSEGGLAMPYPQLLVDDQAVAVKLILLPSYSGLLLTGKVLSCLGQQSPYELHIEFTDISDAHRQLIARHIMRLQSQQKLTEHE